MKPIIRKMNEEIFGFINHMDCNPEKPRPVTFWFYSDNEQQIYELAAHMKQNNYTILTCEKSFNGQYLCIAERVFCATEERLNRLCVDMQVLAEKMGVTYDGWETRIDLE
jgi:hypothetical protein